MLVDGQPENLAGVWKAARAQNSDVTEAYVCAALQQLDPLWDELFPAEQARIVQLLPPPISSLFAPGPGWVSVKTKCRARYLVP